MDFGIKLKGGMNYLVYDEMEFYTEMDMSIEQETIYGNIKAMRWSKGGSDLDRDVPVWNDIDVSAAEYTQYWDWMN